MSKKRHIMATHQYWIGIITFVTRTSQMDPYLIRPRKQSATDHSEGIPIKTRSRLLNPTADRN